MNTTCLLGVADTHQVHIYCDIHPAKCLLMCNGKSFMTCDMGRSGVIICQASKIINIDGPREMPSHRFVR